MDFESMDNYEQQQMQYWLQQLGVPTTPQNTQIDQGIFQHQQKSFMNRLGFHYEAVQERIAELKADPNFDRWMREVDRVKRNPSLMQDTELMNWIMTWYRRGFNTDRRQLQSLWDELVMIVTRLAPSFCQYFCSPDANQAMREALYCRDQLRAYLQALNVGHEVCSSYVPPPPPPEPPYEPPFNPYEQQVPEPVQEVYEPEGEDLSLDYLFGDSQYEPESDDEDQSLEYLFGDSQYDTEPDEDDLLLDNLFRQYQ